MGVRFPRRQSRTRGGGRAPFFGLPRGGMGLLIYRIRVAFGAAWRCWGGQQVSSLLPFLAHPSF